MKKLVVALVVCLVFMLVGCDIHTTTVTTSHVEKAKVVEIIDNGVVALKVDFMLDTYYTIETEKVYKIGDVIYIDVFDDGTARIVKAGE